MVTYVLDLSNYELKNGEFDCHRKHIVTLIDEAILESRKQSSNIFDDNQSQIVSIRLTENMIELGKELRKVRGRDDYHVAAFIWCLSRANRIDSDSSRVWRFVHTEKILRVLLSSMIKVEDGIIRWKKPHNPTVKELKRLISLAGSKSPIIPNEVSYDLVSKELDKQDFQAMLSYGEILYFEGDKCILEVLHKHLEEQIFRNVNQLDSMLSGMTRVTQKIHEVIEEDEKRVLAP